MRPLAPAAALAPALAALTGACAPVLSTMQPASVHPGPHAGLAVDGSIAPDVILDAVDTGEALGRTLQQTGTLDDAALASLLTAAGKVLVAPPGVSTQLLLAYGWDSGLELSLRLASSAFRVGTRWQFLRDARHGIDGSVGLGLSAYTAGPFADLFGVLTVGDVARGELDVPLLFGWSNDIGHLWFGGKLQFNFFSVETALDTGTTRAELVTYGGTNRYLGFQLGGAIGYRWLWLAAELTIARLSADVTFDIVGQPSRDVAFSATVVAPSVGVLARF